MQFIYPLLTWAFFLALLPVLIHLINMMRHQRVQWAAMDFLLKSHKKHRHWVWLKQMLLLATRMLLFALLVAMFAGLITSRQWTNLFGGNSTHHYILLDDSFSMSDRSGGSEAFDRAKLVISQITEEAARKDTPQKISLLRFSRSGKTSVDQDILVAPMFDLISEEINSSLDELLEDSVQLMSASEQANGPQQSLFTLDQTLKAEDESQSSIIYMVSDFRRKDWGTPTEIKQQLQSITELADEIHFVSCSRPSASNLSIDRIETESATLAAGVPTFLNVTVKNHAEESAKNVQLNLSLFLQDTLQDDISNAGKNLGQEQPQPTVFIEEVPPGEEVTRRVQVYFSNAGNHLVRAELPADTILVDNSRIKVFDVPDQVPVLVVDGSLNGRNSFHLNTVFTPNSTVSTGIQPTVETAAFLRDRPLESYLEYQVIYLLDVPALDESTISKLTQYCKTGRGIAYFVGPNTTLDTLTQLHEAGLIPAPISEKRALPTKPAGVEDPDFVPADHPLFAVFAGQQNPFLRNLQIFEFFKVEDNWKPEPDQGATVLANIRTQSPIMLEQTIGQGTFLTCLTTLSPDWNNWASNPSFVVFILDTQSYLTSNLRTSPDRFVDSEIHFQVPKEEYRPEALVYTPGADRMPTVKSDSIELATNKQNSSLAEFNLQGVNDITGESLTSKAGIYEAWLTKTDGTTDLKRFSLNVDPSESEVEIVSEKELQASLAPVEFIYHSVESTDYDWNIEEGTNWQDYLFYAILFLLLAEQALAYSTSYHPPKIGATSK